MKRLLVLALLAPMFLTALTALVGCDNDHGRRSFRPDRERIERRDVDRREHFERSYPRGDQNDWR